MNFSKFLEAAFDGTIPEFKKGDFVALLTKHGFIFGHIQETKYEWLIPSIIIGGFDYGLSTCHDKNRVVFSLGVAKSFGVVQEPIPDKAFVFCFDKTKDGFVTGFYDAKNNCLFNENGKRGGVQYDYYEFFGGTLPEEQKRMRLKLED